MTGNGGTLGTICGNSSARGHLYSGLLIEPEYHSAGMRPSKTGKSRMLFGMLKSLSPGGPPFCGLTLPNMPALAFTEEPPNVVAERAKGLRR